jgi:NAD(P)-dependent dehydrogenase (short-subunit alcohol dehydrogenase family)
LAAHYFVCPAAHGYASYTRPSSSSLILDLDDPNSKNGNPANRYSITKLLQIFITRKMAALPLAERLVVNSVHPNLCKSELGREAPRLLHWLLNKLGWKTQTGAACVSGLYPTCSPNLLNTTPLTRHLVADRLGRHLSHPAGGVRQVHQGG